MKKISLVIFSLILLLLSCEKDSINNPIVNISPRPAGKYLKEINLYGFPWLNIWDTLKFQEFEYDENRYLKKIYFYIPETNTLNSYKLFFYNNNGLIRQIDWFHIEGDLIEKKTFKYNNELIESSELYREESGNLRLIKKSRFENDLGNQSIREYTFFWRDSDLVESKFYTDYYFNSDGNIYKTHYYGYNYEFIDEYEFDNMINPFSNLNIPISRDVIRTINNIQYLSNNNVIYHMHTYLDYTNMSDTIVETSDGQIFEYKYIEDFLVDKNGYEFYKYINIE